MKNKDKYLEGRSYREYLRFITHLPLIENYSFKAGQNILELSNNNLFLSKALPHEISSNIQIQTLNFSTQANDIENALRDITKRNNYAVVFCFLYTDFIQYESELLLEYIYHVLRPGGELVLSHPTNMTATIFTYRQLVASGKFPFLPEVVNTHDISFNRIKQTINQLPFSDIKFTDYIDKVTLPYLDTFKRYLHETAYLYKKVTSTESSDKIIDMQTDLFDDYCQKHFDGEYVFEFTLRLIRAIK